MIVAAALCPHPPLLLPGAAGAAEVLPDLVQACGRAVRWLVDQAPDEVVVAGADGDPLWPDAAGRRALPLSLAVGVHLLTASGWDGPTRLRAVPPDGSAEECAALGAGLGGVAARVALLVTGDGSARRGPRAPGFVDGRAGPFDDAVLAAVRDGDAAALLALDVDLARELLVAGRPAWQALAGAVPQPRSTDVLYADDPFGVRYVVAMWTP